MRAFVQRLSGVLMFVVVVVVCRAFGCSANNSALSGPDFLIRTELIWTEFYGISLPALEAVLYPMLRRADQVR